MQANRNDMHYAVLSGKQAKYQEEVPIVRSVTRRSDENELESAVIKEVSAVLRAHPKVLFSQRVNSGAAWLPGKGGKDAPVAFFRILRHPSQFGDMTIVDFIGFFVHDGRVHPFAFEAKRRNWVFGNLEREAKQRNYLRMISSFGGVSGFVTSGDDVFNLLNRG